MMNEAMNLGNLYRGGEFRFETQEDEIERAKQDYLRLKAEGRIQKNNYNMKKKRDYKKEYRDFHGKPKQIKNRAKRNAARRKLGLKVGDGKEVDHKIPLSKGGSNNINNLRVVLRKTNRKKGIKK